MTRYLYGMHDPGGEHLFADAKGWIVFTEAIGSDPNDKSGRDYRQWANAGYGVLVRLNNGYGNAGTIPTPDKYDDFAMRAANFVARSEGCNTWIIANEPNHSNERPDGQPITPAMYIDCFKRVHAQVGLMAGTRHGLIPAPVALWNVETGDWLEYQEAIWRGLWRLSAGVAIHTYSHGASPQLITSQEKMGAPYQNRFYHFQAYRDLMIRVPVEMRGLPAYVTETDQNDPWVDANTGWVREAYAEIDRWNKTDGTQKIHCLCLYRWPDFDKWYIEGKQGVIEDFKAAIGRGYTSPVGVTNVPQTTHIPAVSTGSAPTVPPRDSASHRGAGLPDLPERDWDERLTARGVRIETPPIAPGQKFWRIVRARWWNEQESQGRHHIYLEAIDEDGKPVPVAVNVRWPSGSTDARTNGQFGFDAGNFPMSKSLNEFSVTVDNDDYPSETLKGIGMGANGNSGIHTSTGVTFQLTTMPQAQPTKPSEQPQPASALGYVTAFAGLNLRQLPDAESDILAAIAFGESVRITAVANIKGWVRARYGDKEGWVASEYISLQPPIPTGEPVGEAPPAPVGDNWQRSIAWTLRWEGGLSVNPEDHGNWTGGRKGQGELKGTNFGISAASYPNLDIRNLTKEEAMAIYHRDYWQPSGAVALTWPFCLIVFDTAVLHGVGAAKAWLAEVGPNPFAFAAKRLRVYTKMDNWGAFGVAWVNRVADLLLEASKP